MEYEGQPETDSGARLFVYGTLRKGFRSHKLLQRFHARLIASGSVQGRLYDLGDYPGAVNCTGTERVCGEVYFLPHAEAAFRALDRFEGFDPARPESNEFERGGTTVTLADGRKVRAWIYWLPGAPATRRRVRAGNYAMRRKWMHKHLQ
jgi:gamma-glutamylcyclotransferase (GGCT)/AIG2-like uncharacterized protein YtfP